MCMFCRSLFVLLSFFFWPLSHCVVCSSIYGFWLPVLVSSNTFYSEQDNQRIVRKRDRFTSVLRKTKHNMLQISFMVGEKNDTSKSVDSRRMDFDRILFSPNHERTKAYCWNARHHMNLNYTWNGSQIIKLHK